MALEAISRVEPKRKHFPSLGVSAGVGAAVGAGLRYIIPTKAELSSVDSFVSTTAMAARSQGRSILKYGAIGALFATGIALLSKAIHNRQNSDTSVEYTKLGALVDAPDYACEIMWYGE